MATDRAELGRRAEALVARRLEARGFTVLGRNVRVGRLELDVIARKAGLVVVCEVRARSSDRWVTPVETIDRRKVQRVRRAAAQWLSRSNLGPVDVRFDAASVIIQGDSGRIDYYEDAF